MRQLQDELDEKEDELDKWRNKAEQSNERTKIRKRESWPKRSSELR